MRPLKNILKNPEKNILKNTRRVLQIIPKKIKPFKKNPSQISFKQYPFMRPWKNVVKNIHKDIFKGYN